VTDGKSPGRPPERIRVRLLRRDIGEHRDVLWPKNWPLPEPGSRVTHDDLGGFVDHVEFQPGENQIVVRLR